MDQMYENKEMTRELAIETLKDMLRRGPEYYLLIGTADINLNELSKLKFSNDAWSAIYFALRHLEKNVNTTYRGEK